MGLRLTEAQYEELLKTGRLSLCAPKAKNSAKLSQFAPAPGQADSEDRPKRKSATRISIDSIKHAVIEKDGDWVFARGVRLLNPNQTLRMDHRAMYGYIKACHKLAANMAYLLPRGAVQVDLELYRAGKRLIDNDAVVIGFKFIIDGLRRNGIFPDDSPEFVRRIDYEQHQGEYEIGIRVTKIK